MEFGHPFELLNIKRTSNSDDENMDNVTKNQNNGFFFSLVRQTGEPTFNMLFKIAEEVNFFIFTNKSLLLVYAV